MLPPHSIDLNCDLGEGALHDEELMPLVSSANIACGAHAGDEATMRQAVRLALAWGVAIGAHPGFADREHFGRREWPATPEEVRLLVLDQTRRLQAVAAESGARVVHLKPHGALYNMAAREPLLAAAIAEAAREADPGLRVVGLSGSESLPAAGQLGLPVAHEVFADRTYQRDGSLTPRSRPGALIEDPDAAVAQVLRLVREGKVRATDGVDVEVRADTVCLHGDEPQAVAFAQRLRRDLAAAGILIQRLDR